MTGQDLLRSEQGALLRFGPEVTHCGGRKRTNV